MFSQFDNELRRDKTITAMSDLLRKGYWLWTPPLGYTNKKKYHKVVEWNIVINESGKQLKKAFKWKLMNTYSNVEIVSRLNAMGVKVKEKRLHEIFKNPFYCGILVSKMLPGEVIEGKHKPLVSKKDFLMINSERTSQLKEYKTDNEMLPLKYFVYCESCHKPLTGYLVKKKGLYYYKCRTKGCCCNKSAKKLHLQFENKLSGYQIDYKYIDVMKDVMTYTYDSLTKENKENESSVKKQISGLQSKLETMEERFAIGEINKEIYEKFKVKYQSEINELESNSFNSSISSSNLEKAIKKALRVASNLNEL